MADTSTLSSVIQPHSMKQENGIGEYGGSGSTKTFHNGGPVVVVSVTDSRRPTSAPNQPPPAPEHVQDVCRALAFYIVHQATNNNMKLDHRGRKYLKHARTLKRTVDELSQRHAILFKSMVGKLDLNRDNLKAVFENVANEIFKDNNYNWGRIVSVYAFGGRLAKYCLENNITNNVETVAEFVGNYVAKNLAWWIHKSGGWDAFDAYFPEQKHLEDGIWTGLLCTAFGLAALAAAAVVR